MDEDQKVETTSQEKEKPENNTPQGADLNISDLMAVRSVIDIASQRGAFKAAELESVGKIYNKLNNFLESVAKKET
jgi:uncharacterized ubiquitin-like protein YukD